MSNFDSSQDKTSPGRAAPNIAFGQAMAGVAARRSQIVISLDSQDFGQVEHAFSSATNLWLAGRSAYRRLVASDKSASRDVKVATETLNEHYVALLELFARAHRVIEELDVKKALDDLRMTLVTAMAQPLSEMAETALDVRRRR